MPAYAIFIKEKTRVPKEIEIYSGLAGATLDGHPAKVLAAYGKQECPEGAPSEGVVLLEFPSIAAAKAWYDGPGYRAAREHRFKGADYRVIFFEGV